jgi:hypothetical protein
MVAALKETLQKPGQDWGWLMDAVGLKLGRWAPCMNEQQALTITQLFRHELMPTPWRRVALAELSGGLGEAHRFELLGELLAELKGLSDSGDDAAHKLVILEHIATPVPGALYPVVRELLEGIKDKLFDKSRVQEVGARLLPRSAQPEWITSNRDQAKKVPEQGRDSGQVLPHEMASRIGKLSVEDRSKLAWAIVDGLEHSQRGVPGLARHNYTRSFFSHIPRMLREQLHPAGKPESPPRYTNVCITKTKARSVLPSRRSLRARGDYALRLNIGPWTPHSVVQNARPFRGDLLPPTEEGHWLQVVIASQDFHIEQRYHHVFLPRVGASYVCPCKAGGEHTCKASDRQPYLFVPIRAPGLIESFGEGPRSSPLRSLFAQRNLRSRQARLRIAIYYKKNLVESQLLTADVRAVEGGGTGYSSRIDYSLTSHLSDVSFLSPRDINILTNDVDDKSHKLIINGDLKEPISFNLTEAQRSGAVDAARQALRDISVKETKGWGATVATYNSLYNDKNEKDLDSFVTDLRALAPLGKDLWDALLQTRPQARRRLRDLLKQSPRRPAIIQVSRVEGSSLVFPWSFIYEIPLESDSSKHTPCPLLTKGTWKPEFISTLDHCPFEQKHQKNVLCPFGFWGFNHIIEQVPSMPEGRALPLWIKRAHDKPRLVMGISLDLDPDLTQAHKNELQKQLTGLQVIPKESLADVEAALAEEKLELVYFYCHGRRQPLPGGKSSTPYIEVGKSQGIAPGDITTWHDSDWGVDHWKEISPLVFINGCHTAELTPEVLVNFVDSFIGVYAAGVIGTEILLVQEVANEAAEQLLTVMNNKDKTGNSFGAGEALRQMRLHFLGKGNLLGLAYTPYCSADLKLAN